MLYNRQINTITCFLARGGLAVRILSTEQMLNEPVCVHDLLTTAVRQPLGYSYTFRNQMRTCSVLCLYLSGRREYTLADNGEHFFLTPGDVLYIPQYSRYGFKITDAGENGSDFMIAVNFSMTDASGEPVNYGPQPRILLRDRLHHYFTLFQRMEATSRTSSGNAMLLKSLFFGLLHEILCELNSTETMNAPYRAILPAISHIENDPASDDAIPDLARLCGVSQTQFRRLFSEYTGGLSPVEYRNTLRIEKADRLIRSGFVTVEQAARESGFSDLSHFYRVYKRLKGSTPVRGGQPG